MRRVYCPKHGETTDIQFRPTPDSEWSKSFCFKCIVEFLEKNICECEVKEDFENGKETEKES